MRYKTQKLTYEEVVECFRSHGCELLDKNYINGNQIMNYRCKCGNIGVKKFYAFKNTPCCNNCGKTCKLNKEQVGEFFKANGCQLLDEYRNNDQPLKFICKCGRTSQRTYKNFKKTPQCATCSGKHHYTLNEVKEIFKNQECELLSNEYTNGRLKLDYVCSCGTQAKIALEKFLLGRKCHICALRIGAKNGNWNPDREFVKLNKILTSRSHSHIRFLLKKQNLKKIQNKSKYLGYTVSQLRERITQHQNWNNVKNEKWHIDHIFPASAFLEQGITDLKIINALDNLQPLTEKDNLSKSAKYDKKEFLSWIKLKGIELSSIQPI